MNTTTQNIVEHILENAQRDKKRDYRIYSKYKMQLENLDSPLTPLEYEQVVRKLAQILKV